ncbi:MAG: beta-lactamase family protein [Candidatus Saganbacteria bacterium]|nr:beta-lactamase family protein [Candidatus Saganbacteria bacterium]
MKRLKLFLIFSILSCLFAPSALARGLGSRTELETWLAGIMAAHLKDYNIAGATLCLVKNGKVFLYEGYGFADIDNKQPVDPEKTLFRPGSCSKLLTWTAVMQLVEEGKLDLDTDINNYLKKFKIPNTSPEPITLRHLITHTPGFEDSEILLFVKSYGELDPLEKYLIQQMPKRIWPAGLRPAYSNYGATLAGYIVQEVSGQPFDDYIKDHILDPLDMDVSTFKQEQTEAIKTNLSHGYVFANGKFIPEPFEFCNAGPAGSLTTTALDMAKFMIAHLNKGRPLLKTETAAEMHKQQFTFDPRQNGICLGFYEMNYNGVRIIGHGGDTILFHSLLALLPEEDIGLFVSYNSPGGTKARDELLHALIDRYYPQSLEPAPAADPKLVKEAKALAGTYLPNRRPFSTFEKAFQLFAPAISIKALDDGTLLVKELRMAQLGPDFFRDFYDKNTAVVKKTGGRYYFNNFFPCVYFEKLNWLETARFHRAVLWACVIVLFSAVLLWPILLLIDKSHHVRIKGSTFAIWISILAGGLDLVFLPLIFINLEPALYDPRSLDWILVMPIVAAVLTLGSLIYTILAWKNKYWSLLIRAHYTLVTAALLCFIWWLYYWNLLGFRY